MWWNPSGSCSNCEGRVKRAANRGVVLRYNKTNTTRTVTKSA